MKKERSKNVNNVSKNNEFRKEEIRNRFRNNTIVFKLEEIELAELS